MSRYLCYNFRMKRKIIIILTLVAILAVLAFFIFRPDYKLLDKGIESVEIMVMAVFIVPILLIGALFILLDVFSNKIFRSKKTLVVIIWLIIVAGLGWILYAGSVFIQGSFCCAEPPYYSYINNAGRYSVPIRKGWGVNDTDWSGKVISSINIAPFATNKISDEEFRKIDPTKTSLIAINTMTPGDEIKAAQNYKKLYSSFAPMKFTNYSGTIKELRTSPILEGCTGTAYAVLTAKRIYDIKNCHANATEKMENDSDLQILISGLKEM